MCLMSWTSSSELRNTFSKTSMKSSAVLVFCKNSSDWAGNCPAIEEWNDKDFEELSGSTSGTSGWFSLACSAARAASASRRRCSVFWKTREIRWREYKWDFEAYKNAQLLQPPNNLQQINVSTQISETVYAPFSHCSSLPIRDPTLSFARRIQCIAQTRPSIVQSIPRSCWESRCTFGRAEIDGT